MDMNQHGLEPSLPRNSQCLVSNNLLKGDQWHIRKEALLILALIWQVDKPGKKSFSNGTHCKEDANFLFIFYGK